MSGSSPGPVLSDQQLALDLGLELPSGLSQVLCLRETEDSLAVPASVCPTLSSP